MKHGLIDQVEFEVWAGNGGRGVVHFRRERHIRKGGPDGGDGGNGGSIYLLTNPHMTTLLEYAGKVRFEAKSGEPGSGRNKHGKDAADVVLPVPVGTVVYEKNNNTPTSSPPKLGGEMEEVHEEWVKLFDLNKPNEKALVAQGGAGGRGNAAFKSSVNTTPMQSEPGGHGERKLLRLEMKILADVGLVGLPNVGKSTLLSVLTAAKPEIANYPFTTISPNLGVLSMFSSTRFDSAVGAPTPNASQNASPQKGQKKSLIVADIPGLIEDAHKGKGLGMEFLRHIERCKVLVYVVAPELEQLEAGNLKVVLQKQLETVMREVRAYGEGVIEKPSLVVVNKVDLLSEDQRKTLPKDWLQVSAATVAGVEALKARLVELYDTNRVETA